METLVVNGLTTETLEKNMQNIKSHQSNVTDIALLSFLLTLNMFHSFFNAFIVGFEQINVCYGMNAKIFKKCTSAFSSCLKAGKHDIEKKLLLLKGESRKHVFVKIESFSTIFFILFLLFLYSVHFVIGYNKPYYVKKCYPKCK